MVSKRSETLLLALAVMAIFYIIYPEKDPDTIRATRTASDVSYPSLAMKEMYIDQAVQRKLALKSISMKTNEGLDAFYDVLVPEVFCLELVRVGEVGEDGKWMCSPQRLPTHCAIVAVGFRNQVSFFEQLQHITKKRCTLVGYDEEEQEESTKEVLRKINGVTNIARVTNEKEADAVSYEMIMKKNEMDQMDVLKVVVTDSEHDLLLEYLETNEVPQLLIEVRRNPLKADKSLGDGTFVVKLLKHLSELGYLLAASSINPSDNLSEFTFLHGEHLRTYKASILAKYLS